MRFASAQFYASSFLLEASRSSWLFTFRGTCSAISVPTRRHIDCAQVQPNQTMLSLRGVLVLMMAEADCARPKLYSTNLMCFLGLHRAASMLGFTFRDLVDMFHSKHN